jgi:tripartite-type tricarboxylate transporter receptor subunit TctC
LPIGAAATGGGSLRGKSAAPAALSTVNNPTAMLNTAMNPANAALIDPEMKSRLANLGGTPLVGSPADFGKLIANEIEKWGKLIRAASIKAE